MSFRQSELSAAWAPVPVRLAVGIIFLAHGVQKVLGHTGLSATWGNVLGGLETFAGLAILCGWAVRLWALVLSLFVLGPIVFVRPPQGFFVLPGNNPENVQYGFEFPLALLALCFCLTLTGAGRASVENWAPPRSPDDSDVGIGQVQP